MNLFIISKYFIFKSHLYFVKLRIIYTYFCFLFISIQP
nr:MAG TPA: hypothetical protein [Bacteriophage sp.]